VPLGARTLEKILHVLAEETEGVSSAKDARVRDSKSGLSDLHNSAVAKRVRELHQSLCTVVPWLLLCGFSAVAQEH
jgi:hypothetical protein